jgi:hypothetical protein
MAKYVSDIEDGFALKREREKTSKGRVGSSKGSTQTLGGYTMSNPSSKRAISNYVEIQAREKVQHAERMMSEHILGHDHGCWDVHTNRER